VAVNSIARPIFVTLDFARETSMSSHASQTLFLNGPTGRLEAILWTPNHPRVLHLAAVICHPHPLFGGTLHNKVVYQAAKSIDALRIPVLRFNFRGAGLSAGAHDKGRGEQGDVQAAIDFLAAEFPRTPLVLGGFSFGSWVGLRMGCADPRVTDLIGLGVPVNDSDFTYLSTCVKPKLFVSGSHDEHGAAKKLEELVAMLPGENRLVLIDGTDHFFTGHLPLLDRAITDWLVQRHPDLVAA
jgi:alpha/beta superfamily hydrolase